MFNVIDCTMSIAQTKIIYYFALQDQKNQFKSTRYCKITFVYTTKMLYIMVLTYLCVWIHVPTCPLYQTLFLSTKCTDKNYLL